MAVERTLREIGNAVGGTVVGDPDCVIHAVAGIDEAQEGQITFIANAKYVRLLPSTRASAVIVPEGLEIPEGTNAIVHENPSMAFVKATRLFSPEPARVAKGVSDKASIGKNVRLGKNVSIEPYAVIGDEVAIGDNTRIGPLVYIGRETEIGCDCVIYPNVTIRENTVIGDRVIVHSGTVIAADGFGYVPVDGKHVKIPQTGTVCIEDDVEIGANATIDRARFDRTVIGRGTKIDNLVMVAHNVKIGEDCIVVAQVGISGSTQIGRNVILAGQAGLVGHIKIGDNARITAQAGVTKSVPAGATFSGTPARPFDQERKAIAATYRIPELIRELEELREKVKSLEETMARMPAGKPMEGGTPHKAKETGSR